MRIVRLVHGLRAFAALAVLSAVSVLPAVPADAGVTFAGACTVSGHPLFSSLTPTTVGGWSGFFNFGASCIYHTDTTSSMTGTGVVSGTVGPCGTGVVMQSTYQVDTFGMRFHGPLVIANDGASLSVTFVSTSPPTMAFSGVLVPTTLSSTKCPTGWTGVLAVEDPTLDDVP